MTAALLAACNRDVGEARIATGNARAVPAAASDALVGIDLGFATTAPLREYAVAGATLPRSGGSDITVAFVAFATGAAADDGDGQGRALDRSQPVPTDGNGADDVFVAAIVNQERIIAGQPVPTAFVQGLAPVFHDVRCTRCHSYHYPGGYREHGHFGVTAAGSNVECIECHKAADVLVPGQALAAVNWIAPDAEQLIQPTQDFRGKSDRELYDLVLTKADPKAHLQTDDRILWALGHGRVPFQGTAVGGPIPMQTQQWLNLVEAWAQAGLPFSTEDAVHDVVLASRRLAGDAAGDGASARPSLAFAPNPAYAPGAPAAAALGTLFVAYESTASDLTAAAPTVRHVYRSAIEVWLDGSARIDLRPLAGQTVLVSATAAGGSDADGESGSPVLDASGRLCAFTSTATDLVNGFSGTAGVANVYRRDVDAGSTVLISHAAGMAARGGNGDSEAPAISGTGGVVAFASAASDLVAADTNAGVDVFAGDGSGDLQRVNLRNGAAEVFGGSSGGATVFRDDASGDSWVAFESSADFGIGGGVPQVYLHHLQSLTTLAVAAGAGPVRGPRFAADGGRLYLTTANAVDQQRRDGNGVDDVLALDFAALRSGSGQQFARLSLAASGNDADGASTAVAAGGFRQLDGSFASDRLLLLTTAATNLGRTPHGDAVLAFAVDRSIPRVVAGFTSQITRGVVPFTVQFQDLSNNATSWSWDFGDGGTSTEQNPSHTYTQAGTHTVALTVGGTIGMATASQPGFVQALTAPLSWTTIYANESMLAVCAGCHNGGSPARFPMGDAATAYANLVNVNSVAGCAPQKRVLPGDSAQSVLMRAIAETPQCVSFRMGTLGPQARKDIADWIDFGVPP